MVRGLLVCSLIPKHNLTRSWPGQGKGGLVVLKQVTFEPLLSFLKTIHISSKGVVLCDTHSEILSESCGMQLNERLDFIELQCKDAKYLTIKPPRLRNIS